MRGIESQFPIQRKRTKLTNPYQRLYMKERSHCRSPTRDFFPRSNCTNVIPWTAASTVLNGHLLEPSNPKLPIYQQLSISSSDVYQAEPQLSRTPSSSSSRVDLSTIHAENKSRPISIFFGRGGGGGNIIKYSHIELQTLNSNQIVPCMQREGNHLLCVSICSF